MKIGQDGDSLLLDGGVDRLELFNDGLVGLGFSLHDSEDWFRSMFLDKFAFGDHV
jgi:hypothetical protein